MDRIRAIVMLTGGLLAACGQQAPAPVVFGHREQAPRQVAVPTQQGPAAMPAARQSALPDLAPESVTVQPGDTLYALARRHDRPVRAIIDDNNLQPPYVLQPGQRLRLPGGRFHVVQRGETLYGVSRTYSVDLFSIVQANDLQPPYALNAGQQLRIPGGSDPSPATAASLPATPGRGVQVETLSPPGTASTPPVSADQPAALPPVQQQPATDQGPAPLPQADVPSRGTAVPSAETAPASPAATATQEATLPARSGKTFSWPVRGRVLAGFGPTPDGLHNDGINISARAGAPVIAAENGVVVYAGAELKGFGNLLLVRHADGWITAYAHLDRMLVKKGQKVTRGQAIGTVGSSGGVGQPQLHFEIRRGTQAVDPAKFLSVA